MAKGRAETPVSDLADFDLSDCVLPQKLPTRPEVVVERSRCTRLAPRLGDGTDSEFASRPGVVLQVGGRLFWTSIQGGENLVKTLYAICNELTQRPECCT